MKCCHSRKEVHLDLIKQPNTSFINEQWADYGELSVVYFSTTLAPHCARRQTVTPPEFNWALNNSPGRKHFFIFALFTSTSHPSLFELRLLSSTCA